MTGHRMQRAEKEIQSLVANYLLKGFKGTLSGLVTVARVQVTQDMKQAKVYISVMGSEIQIEKSMTALDNYRLDVQQHLAKSLNTKHSPKIQFFLDHSLEEGFNMTKKIESLGITQAPVIKDSTLKKSESDQDSMSNYHGILLVNKPSGITSFDVVSKIRKIYSTKEIGHAGTLDPLATGLLVILIGEATKLSDYALKADKSYIAKIKLGVTYDTLDVTGKLLSQKDVKVSLQDLTLGIQELSGKFLFSVPAYSAVKVDGKKMYQYARSNQEVVAPQKEMSFYNISLLGSDLTSSEEKWVEVALTCSKGSFIRTWADELGKKLGCGASIQELKRIGSSPYELTNAYTLRDLETYNSNSIKLSEALISIDTIAQIYHQIDLSKELEGKVRNGLIPYLIDVEVQKGLLKSEVVALRSEQGHLVALVGTKSSGKIGILRVFKER